MLTLCLCNFVRWQLCFVRGSEVLLDFGSKIWEKILIHLNNTDGKIQEMPRIGRQFVIVVRVVNRDYGRNEIKSFLGKTLL